MNVISSLPRWAQAPTHKFITQGEVDGAKPSAMDQDSFDSSFQFAANVALLAAGDEVPGEDSALGQPGVVKREGLTLTYQGDTSSADGELEAVLTGKDQGVEFATYVQTGPSGFTTLQMTNERGNVEVLGSVVQQQPQGIAGYIVSGEFPA